MRVLSVLAILAATCGQAFAARIPPGWYPAIIEAQTPEQNHKMLGYVQRKNCGTYIAIKVDRGGPKLEDAWAMARCTR